MGRIATAVGLYELAGFVVVLAGIQMSGVNSILLIVVILAGFAGAVGFGAVVLLLWKMINSNQADRDRLVDVVEEHIKATNALSRQVESLKGSIERRHALEDDFLKKVYGDKSLFGKPDNPPTPP